MMLDPHAHEPKDKRIKRITRDIYQRRHAPWAVDADIVFLLHQVVRDDGGVSEMLSLLQAQAPVLSQIFGNLNKLRDDIANLDSNGQLRPKHGEPAAQLVQGTADLPRTDNWGQTVKNRALQYLDKFQKKHPSWVASKDEAAGQGWCEVIVSPQYEDEPRHCQNAGSYVERDRPGCEVGRTVCGRHLATPGLTYGPARTTLSAPVPETNAH